MNATGTGLQPFYAMEINALAHGLEAAGRTVCHLEVGEPDAPPAPKVREAVRAVLDDPQKYTHFAGLP
jgi:aspartate/methionine/tyrosine aminotransferase